MTNTAPALGVVEGLETVAGWQAAEDLEAVEGCRQHFMQMTTTSNSVQKVACDSDWDTIPYKPRVHTAGQQQDLD